MENANDKNRPHSNHRNLNTNNQQERPSSLGHRFTLPKLMTEAISEKTPNKASGKIFSIDTNNSVTKPNPMILFWAGWLYTYTSPE